MCRWATASAVWIGLFCLACDDGDSTPPPPDAAAPEADTGPVDGRVPDAAGPRLCVRDEQCPNGSFCPDSSGDSACEPGCRTAPDSCRAADRFSVCDPTSRGCIDAPCADDVECRAGQYCADGACVEGCRLEPNDCPLADGRPQGCDPETRDCRPLSVCCGDDGACSMTLDDACGGDVLAASLSCRPDPCGSACEGDDDCADGTRCSADGRCIDGCRDVQGDCPGDTACDPASLQCVRRPCNRNAQCPDWMYCGDAGLCQTGCRQAPDNCAGETRCGPDRSCGSACLEDGDCDEGQYCDAGRGVCRNRCLEATHSGCVAFERCDAGRCVPGCADDPAEIEGDDDRASAPAVEWSGGVVQSARYANRFACPADADVLAVDGPRIEATLSYDEVDGVLALRILDPAGAILAEDSVSGSPKRLRVDAPRAFVEVIGIDLRGRVPYRLELRRADADACFPDARDPGDDRVAGATRVGQRPQASFVDLIEGAACPGDVDWACFSMAAADGLGATLIGCEGLSGAIYRGDAVDGEPIHTLEADGERLRFVADPGRGAFTDGDWCIAVRNMGDVACEDYALALSFERRGEICTDPLEPDNRIEDALLLDGGGPLADAAGRLPYDVEQTTDAGARACIGDLDRYGFTADAGDGVMAWLIADGPGAEQLTLDFQDADGRPLGSRGGASAPGEPPRAARVSAARDGRMYVVVGGGRDDAVDYRLAIVRTPGDGTCPEDGWENVDIRDDTGADAQAPADVEPGRIVVEGAALCHPNAADEDWYRVPIDRPRTRVCIGAAFRHAVADMTVQVFRAPEGRCGVDVAGECCDVSADCDPGFGCAAGFCRAPIAEGASRTDDEFVDLDKTLMAIADDLLVRVLRDPDDRPGVDDGPATYDLTITRAPEDPDGCAPDWHERLGPNDNRASATALGPGREGLCDTWICDEERAAGDWFTIRVPAGSDRTVFVEFDSSEGSLLLSAIDPIRDPERLVESVERGTDVQCINVRGGAADRTVLLQINADDIEPGGDRRVDYALRVEPTDLGLFPRGACDDLAGGAFPDAMWPRLDL